MSKKPYVPVFELNKDKITDPEELIAYHIRHYFYIPKNITNNYSNNEKSFM